MDEKIKVTSGGVSLYAYGQGGHLLCSFTTETEEDAYKLKAAIEALVEHVKPEAP